MYRVDSVGSCPPRTTDALLDRDVSGQFQYDLQLLDGLSDYRDKLAIEWGPVLLEVHAAQSGVSGSS